MLERLHTSHDIDHRFSGEAWNSSTADMFDRTYEPLPEIFLKMLLLSLELGRLGGVVRHDSDRRVRVGL